MKNYKHISFDDTNPYSIEAYAKKLLGKTFRDIVGDIKIKRGNKGGLGQLLEEHYFKYKLNSNSEADFKKAGVELKVTGYKKNKSGKKVAKERLVLSMINYMKVYKENFDESALLSKNLVLLIIFYLYLKGINRLDFPIDYVSLFQIPENDLKIIEDDWNTIIDKVKKGKAHEISEGDTNYLGACTKGTSSKSVRNQPFNNIKARQRAFCLKSSYLTHVLNEYIIKGKTTYNDSIIKNIDELRDTTFEDYVLDKINKHRGKKIIDLANELDVKTSPKSKSFTADIAKAMLNVQGKDIEEFKKANIKVKAIRINKKGKIKEHMSFPTFQFTELIEEDWETSTLRNLFLNTRFLFIVYRLNESGELYFDKSMFWNIPYNDLETDVKQVWTKTVETIKEGIKTWKVGSRTFNNLPSPSENPISHVRPHGRDKQDTFPLPQGGELTKQSFWLKNTYILNQINKGG
ncbi:MAG: restriction endonuclease [Firmicutes bacterium]|nr:restriction endonuclease [Bacillota bacterium]